MGMSFLQSGFVGWASCFTWPL